MAFKKMTGQVYPPRLWQLTGYPDSGKSTFAAQMRAPLLVIDADHRFAEVLDVAPGDVLALSDAPADQVDSGRISALLAQHMPGARVGTIVVDSLTAIITPLVVQAVQDNDAGLNKNRVAAFKPKALAMRQLQDSVTRWGTDVLWIYHLQDGRDAQARAITRASISRTELARLTRSVNLQLEIVRQGDKRGIKVIWARRGRCGTTLWDGSGKWAGMPEKVEAAVYDGLSPSDQARIESATPTGFPNPETAIAWGFERGAFRALQHARNAYDKLKRELMPRTAREMAALWVAEVEARLRGEGDDDSNETEGVEPEPGQPPAEASPEAGGDAPAVEGEVSFTCQDCGRPLQDYETNDRTYTVSQLVDIGQSLRDGGILCGPCLKKRKEAASK